MCYFITYKNIAQKYNGEIMNNPWESYPEIWKSQAAFMSWCRGGIRRSLWNKSPIKINFIKKHRIRIANPKKNKRSPAEVWGAKCELCSREFVLREIQVDHKIGNHKLTEINDIQSFIESIVMVEDKDLQLICKKCHKIKTHAERMDISFEEAAKEKKIIAYMKLKSDEQIKILTEYKLPTNNTKIRKNSFIQIINKLPDI